MYSTTKFGTFKLRVHYSNILWYNSNWFCLKFRCSIMVNILGCHAGDLGSIPGGEEAAEACSFSSACLETITNSFLLTVRFGRELFGMMHHPMAPPGTPHLGTIRPYNAITARTRLRRPAIAAPQKTDEILWKKRWKTNKSIWKPMKIVEIIWK